MIQLPGTEPRVAMGYPPGTRRLGGDWRWGWSLSLGLHLCCGTAWLIQKPSLPPPRQVWFADLVEVEASPRPTGEAPAGEEEASTQPEEAEASLIALPRHSREVAIGAEDQVGAKASAAAGQTAELSIPKQFFEKLEQQERQVATQKRRDHRRTQQQRRAKAQALEQLGKRISSSAGAAAGELQTYRNQLITRIRGEYTLPEVLRGRFLAPVQVRFRIDPQGNIADLRLLGGSGSGDVDTLAVAALKRAAPLPPPPPQLGNDMIELTFHP